MNNKVKTKSDSKDYWAKRYFLKVKELKKVREQYSLILKENIRLRKKLKKLHIE